MVISHENIHNSSQGGSQGVDLSLGTMLREKVAGVDISHKGTNPSSLRQMYCPSSGNGRLTRVSRRFSQYDHCSFKYHLCIRSRKRDRRRPDMSYTYSTSGDQRIALAIVQCTTSRSFAAEAVRLSRAGAAWLIQELARDLYIVRRTGAVSPGNRSSSLKQVSRRY